MWVFVLFDVFDMQSFIGLILMQFFQDGQLFVLLIYNLWNWIDVWVEEYYMEFWDQFCEGVINNDLNDFEYQFDCFFFQDVCEFLMIYDG